MRPSPVSRAAGLKSAPRTPRAIMIAEFKSRAASALSPQAPNVQVAFRVVPSDSESPRAIAVMGPIDGALFNLNLASL